MRQKFVSGEDFDHTGVFLAAPTQPFFWKPFPGICVGGGRTAQAEGAAPRYQATQPGRRLVGPSEVYRLRKCEDSAGEPGLCGAG